MKKWVLIGLLILCSSCDRGQAHQRGYVISKSEVDPEWEETTQDINLDVH